MKRSGREILVGTASWADPGFVDTWYPKSLPASQRLSWYAQHFNLVELNSSFYAIPDASMVQRWCQKTPKGFLFDVKLHRLLSRHSTDLKMLSPDLRSHAAVKNGKAVLTAALEKAVAKRFLDQISPFAQYHRLGALLLQLSPSFRPRHHKLTDLDDLFSYLEDYQVAIELRNRDWVVPPQLEATESFFKKRGLTFVCVDAPEDSHFMILPGVDLVTNPHLAYIRMHGRNAHGYIHGRKVSERFDYKYNLTELADIAKRAARLAEEARQVHVIYNNNTANYAPVNAGQFRDLLEEEYPDISTGPELSGEPAGRRGQLEFAAIPRRKELAKTHAD